MKETFLFLGKKEVKSYYFPEGCTEKQKELLKRLAFSEKPEIILSLTNKGGVFLLFTKRLIFFQCVLGSVEVSLSFLLNCLMYLSFASKIVFVHSFDN